MKAEARASKAGPAVACDLTAMDSLNIGDTAGGPRPAHATLLDAKDGR